MDVGYYPIVLKRHVNQDFVIWFFTWVFGLGLSD